MRSPTLIATILAAGFLAGPVSAQMAPGTRAGDAPGMGSIGGQLEGRRLGPPAQPALPVPTTPGIVVTPAPMPAAPSAAAPESPARGMPAPAAPAPEAPANPAPAPPAASAPASPDAAAPNPAAPSTEPGSPRPATSGEPLAPPRADPVPSGPGLTEQQARTQLSGAGYGEVQDLQRGENGAWRGRAMRDGQPVSVTIGTDGEVTAAP
jgi:outer membrane biosynthesis protein TonB